MKLTANHGLGTAESTVHNRVVGPFDVGWRWILLDRLTAPDQAGLLSRLKVEVETDESIDKGMDMGNGLSILLSVAFEGDGPWRLSFSTGKERTGEDRQSEKKGDKGKKEESKNELAL